MQADGVELLGQLEGSGYSAPRFLVRRADGQTLQLTSLLYATLASIDGQRTYADIAECITEQIDRKLLAEDVQKLIDGKLRPLGLLTATDGAQPEVAAANPLLGLRLRYMVSNPRTTRRITRPFALLFKPFVAIPLLLLFAGTSGWVLWEQGLAPATRDALYRPEVLLLLIGLTMVSAGFHEFGHAAACRYGGATPGAMGAGLYLVWPAFYTDVSDSYRLNRWGRLRVDLGGLYFNAIVAAATFGVWLAGGAEALLLLIPIQLLQMLRQLLPFVRFDGYHILADITGVPDLFAHMKPTLLALLPWNWRKSPRQSLKPWARAVVTTWVLIVLPVLAFALVTMVRVFPRVAATAWDSLQRQATVLSQNFNSGEWGHVALGVVAMFTIALPVASMSYMLWRLVRRTVSRVWRQTDGYPARRTGAVLIGLALIALLAWAWWPRDQYQPIQANERGTLLEALPASYVQPLLAAPAAAPTLPAGMFTLPTTGLEEISGSALTVPETFEDQQLQPRLGLVVTPREDAEFADGEEPAQEQVIVLPPPEETEPGDTANTFPFQPDDPRPGDNQAVALNTTDGSALYDVSIAMVWVTDGENVPVDQRNEAYALASCTDCDTVAVAFQVILVVGQADVVVPQNIAMALNYECDRCDTYALAVQLIASLTEMPSDEALEELAVLWDELEELQANITEIPLDELQTRLAEFEEAILGVLEADGVLASPLVEEDETLTEPEPATSEATTDEDTSSDEGTTGTTSTDEESSTTVEGEDEATATEQATAEAVDETSSEAAVEPSPEAEPEPEPTSDPADSTDTTTDETQP